MAVIALGLFSGSSGESLRKSGKDHGPTGGVDAVGSPSTNTFDSNGSRRLQRHHRPRTVTDDALDVNGTVGTDTLFTCTVISTRLQGLVAAAIPSAAVTAIFIAYSYWGYILHMFTPRYNLFRILRNLAVDLRVNTTLINQHEHFFQIFMAGSNQCETNRNISPACHGFVPLRKMNWHRVPQPLFEA